MKRLLIAFAIVAAAATQSARASDTTDVMTTIGKFVDGFNKGDTAAIAATHADPVFIIDEFPPYVWQGSRAWMAWVLDFDAFAKKEGLTEAKVTLDKPKHIDIVGDRAYVVTPANMSFKVKGEPASETGSIFTLALHKTQAGWRITGWSWAKN